MFKPSPKTAPEGCGYPSFATGPSGGRMAFGRILPTCRPCRIQRPVTLLTDSAGRVWFGFLGSTIAVLDGSTLKTFSSQDGLSVVNVQAIYEHAGHIWVGGERGLAFFQGGRFQSLTADGDIELKGISGIVQTAGGDLWLNARPGIIHIPSEETQRALERPDWHVHCELFDFRDGLPGTAEQGAPLPSALASSDGRLWFRTTGGAVQIDPEHLSRNAIHLRSSFDRWTRRAGSIR